MATTYTLISSNTLSSSAASVTFSSIPSTYTDLVLKCSIRGTEAASVGIVYMKLNGLTSGYSETLIQGNGASASSSRDSSATRWAFMYAPDSTNTANTFNSMEFYIPSYTVSQYKPISGISAQEANSSTAYLTAGAMLLSNTSAISSIEFSMYANIEAGSSFYLYGIKATA